MRRDLERLANERFDLLIIGGGITGASVARDAALRGLSVALVEKNDFACATSAHNSKLIHGGLRYLRNFELSLVRESLKERRIWQRIAPHLVQPLPFLVPVYSGLAARATLSAGLSLYDMLSYDRTWLDDPGQRLPGHSWFAKEVALTREPVMEGPGFGGAFLYYDAQMYSPERLALECVLDAAENNAAPANHLEAVNLLIRDGVTEGATLRDVFSGAIFDVRAKLTLLAGGPWADIFLEHALGRPSKHKLMRSKGIHLIVPSVTKHDALTVAEGSGGHFFVLPWRGHSLLGTTDTEFLGAPDSVGVTEADIEGFLALVNANLPAANLKRGDVQHFYAGLRPLVDDGSGDTYDASRRAELIDHGKDDRVEGLLSAIGGKWTTSRDLAEKTVDAIVKKLGVKHRPCVTGTEHLPGGRIDRFSEFFKRQSPNVLNPEHIVRLYGARVDAMLAGTGPELRKQIAPTGDIGAQVQFAVREEMAMTLEDVVMRRTGIGQLGDPGAESTSAVATLMARELGWADERKRAEIESLKPNFRIIESAA